MGQYPTADWGFLYAHAVQATPRPLIEPFITGFFQNLQKKGLSVVAFAAMNVGPLGAMKSLTQWRHGHLESLGFRGSFFDKVYSLKGFSREPLFYKGILISDQ
ncbi:MAG: hypothetical protein GY915_02155 [bacterium]|nr:hypothetical protein [bacterium]